MSRARVRGLLLACALPWVAAGCSSETVYVRSAGPLTPAQASSILVHGLPTDTPATVPLASPITATPAPTATATDVQAAAASEFMPPSAATPITGPTRTAVAIVSYTDPVAAARAYTTARWTFHSADAAAYTKALEAPGITTPAFQARSAPTALALAQGKNSNDISSVSVTAAGISGEAPRTAVLAYVTVAYTVTDTYTGAVNPHPAAHDWSLRVTRASPSAGWHVDGVAQDG